MTSSSPTLTGPGPCPLCGQPLYGWIMLPAGSGEDRIVDRCESCGVAVERGRHVDVAGEWSAVIEAAADGEIAIPDRGSLQAGIGLDGWAAIDLAPGNLVLTRKSLALLAEVNDHRIERTRWRLWGRNQAWMWQTLLNGLTFHPNFAREARAGRLRMGNARSRFTFVVDFMVTVLGAPLVALVSFPLEALAALARRGGELRARATPARRATAPAGDDASL